MSLRKNRKMAPEDPEKFSTVVEGFKRIYRNKILPLENRYSFHKFCLPQLADQDFDTKPTILLIGQYSTGKTTFINHLLGDSFPGDRTGPHPTTDCFNVVMHGEQEGVIPGHAVVVDPTLPFMSLNQFGTNFLKRFRISKKDTPVLRSINLIDSPGILSGEVQRLNRGYDFVTVLQWFAARVDQIILLFDAHKLDISDEFKRAIEAIKGHDEKVRIVLNKADTVTGQELMRVYGALMWSLGKILLTPEVCRVYVGSFWGEPLKNDYNRRLFEAEKRDLVNDIRDLPRTVAVRKLNDLVKRARQAKVHAYIIKALSEKYNQAVFQKDYKKKEILKSLPRIFQKIQEEQNFAEGDFPNVVEMHEKLRKADWGEFRSFDKKLVNEVNDALGKKIAPLLNMIQSEQDDISSFNRIRGGLFETSIFDVGRGEGVDEGSLQTEWAVDKSIYLDRFQQSKGPDGCVSGAVAKKQMVESKLPNATLAKIWVLADIDKDGKLNENEYCLAMYLINVKLNGFDIPLTLPEHLLPPQRQKFPTC